MGKKTLVIGLGKSGMGAVEFLVKRGDQVVAVDRMEPEFSLFDFDLVVVSPGVPPENVLYQRAIREGIEVIGEAELAFREIKNRVIGVTGSNGKSTTVAMIAHILNRSGRRARALGNIGTALITAVGDLGQDEIVVAELSSFQLETMKTKVLDVAMILNVTPNHLDRHGTMENYYKAKLRIGELVKEGGAFGVSHTVPGGDFVRFACLQMGLTEEEIVRGMEGFKPLPHRLEFVGEVKGVKCYDDSKATTMDAVSYAVKKIGCNIILIAGGRHKGGSFSIWNESFPGRVKAIILLGEAKEVIAKELVLDIPIYFVQSLDLAIEKGLQVASQGDNLILSPGCSSYDMFLNFEKRGEAFKQGLDRESKRYDLSFSAR